MYVCCSSNRYYTRDQVARVATGVVNPLGCCPFDCAVVSNVPMHTIVSLLYSGHRSASLVSMICITISICTPGLTNTVSNNIHKVYFDCLIVRRSGGLFYLPPRHSTSNYRDYWLSGINYIFRNSLFSQPLYRKLIGMELLSWHFPPILHKIFE